MYEWTLYVNDHFENMERYNLTKLQEELRRELGNGLLDQAVELGKGLLSEYKSNPQDWQDKEKWSDIK